MPAPGQSLPRVAHHAQQLGGNRFALHDVVRVHATQAVQQGIGHGVQCPQSFLAGRALLDMFADLVQVQPGNLPQGQVDQLAWLRTRAQPAHGILSKPFAVAPKETRWRYMAPKAVSTPPVGYTMTIPELGCNHERTAEPISLDCARRTSRRRTLAS